MAYENDLRKPQGREPGWFRGLMFKLTALLIETIVICVVEMYLLFCLAPL